MGLPVEMRALEESDADAFAAAFAEMGWDKPAAQFNQYFREQERGRRTVLVAEWEGAVAGYLTILWESSDPVFRSRGIPEIKDFNVLLECRRKGIGSALMDAAEAVVAERSRVVGLGVGLHLGYGSAQRLYVRRGYVPDGAASRTDAVLNPVGLMFELYRERFGTVPLAVSGSSPQPEPKGPPGGEQPHVNAGSDTYPLDVAAALTEDGKTLTVAVVNPTLEPQRLDLHVEDLAVAGDGHVWRMAPGRLDAVNLVGQQPQVVVEESRASASAPLEVPPLSVAIYAWPVR